MKRQEANREILRILENYVETLPEQRFGQIICNYIFPDYGTKDPFYEESVKTLRRLKNETENE